MTLTKNVLGYVTRALAIVAAIIYGLLMVITVVDIGRRALTGKSVEGLVEASPLLLLSAVCLGLAYAELTGTHVRTSLVTERMSSTSALVFRGTMAIFGAALLAWIAWNAIGKTLDAYRIGEATMGLVPILTWPAKALVPVGFFLWMMQLLFRSFEDWRSLRDHPRGTEMSLVEKEPA